MLWCPSGNIFQVTVDTVSLLNNASQMSQHYVSTESIRGLQLFSTLAQKQLYVVLHTEVEIPKSLHSFIQNYADLKAQCSSKRSVEQ